MKTIHKFVLQSTDHQAITDNVLKFLDVQVQNGVPCLWVLVDDTRAPLLSYSIRIYGTGHDLDIGLAEYEYLATYQLYDGSFVGHVFVPRL